MFVLTDEKGKQSSKMMNIRHILIKNEKNLI